ncbi:NAD(P)-dependent alcohol dehydrogenase [Bacillus sp. FJAT-50079]|nr:NAD(P)-dependent alcohol dehydrogenase [Bacillus sp. FJAT-50079]MBS4206870.1 NAD(P)-dependent alcohol dehydrogenase [Bacillus sp. FJAT-50079]
MTDQLMKAAVLDRPHSIHIKQVHIPTIKNDEVLVKVHCIGVCGSDIHYYNHGKIGRYVVKEPIILGHELAGEIVEVGPLVSNVAVGDRVAIEPGVACGRCSFCKNGRYNLCPDVVFMATPPVNGAWAEYIAIRSDFAFKIPDEMSFEEGALLEPLSVGIHAMRRGKVGPEDSIFISGLGPIGLLTIEAAKIFGVTKIYTSDPIQYRREKALEMGATAAFDPLETDIIEEIKMRNGKAADVVIETSGNQHAISSAIKIADRGGRVVLVGLPIVNDIVFDVPYIVDSEIDISGVFRYANTYPIAIQHLQSSKSKIEKIITQKFKLTEIKEAVEFARSEKGIKVMIYTN